MLSATVCWGVRRARAPPPIFRWEERVSLGRCAMQQSRQKRPGPPPARYTCGTTSNSSLTLGFNFFVFKKKKKKRVRRKESLIRYERLESECRGDIGEVPQDNLSKGIFFFFLFFPEN